MSPMQTHLSHSPMLSTRRSLRTATSGPQPWHGGRRWRPRSRSHLRRARPSPPQPGQPRHHGRAEPGALGAPQSPPRSRPGQSGRASPRARAGSLKLPHSVVTYLLAEHRGTGSSLRSGPGAARRPAGSASGRGRSGRYRAGGAPTT